MKIFHYKRPRLLYAEKEGEGLAVEVMYKGRRYGSIIPQLKRRL